LRSKTIARLINSVRLQSPFQLHREVSTESPFSSTGHDWVWGSNLHLLFSSTIGSNDRSAMPDDATNDSHVPALLVGSNSNEIGHLTVSDSLEISRLKDAAVVEEGYPWSVAKAE